jgi:endo-alpha-1,4-polygalactosaminidase (GH114 family)
MINRLGHFYFAVDYDLTKDKNSLESEIYAVLKSTRAKSVVIQSNSQKFF